MRTQLKVSLLLRRLVEWDMHGEQHGTVPLPVSVISRLLENISDGEARELGGWVGVALLDEFTGSRAQKRRAPAPQESNPRKGRAFSYEITEEEGEHVFVLNHSGGSKWAAYYEGMLREVLKDQFEAEPTLTSSGRRVTARLRAS